MLMCLKATLLPYQPPQHPSPAVRGRKGKTTRSWGLAPLQFAYQEKVEDAILYLLHKAHSHLVRGSSAVRIMFFDFSSAFNTIQGTVLFPVPFTLYTSDF